MKLCSSLFGKDVLSIGEQDKPTILQVIDFALSLQRQPQPDLLAGKILANCFFEPSTRTRLSFTAAAMRCGAQVLGFDEATTTSVSKGESLSDTMRIMEGYADLIVLRHPLEGAARLAADRVTIPVINAGDGANQHPTQTLLDLFSMQRSQGRLDDLRVALVGDLKYGRTAHSLAEACSHFNMRLYFVSPESLAMPDHVCDILRKRGIKFTSHQAVESIVEDVDILYVTRLQKERLLEESRYGYQQAWQIQLKQLEKARDNLRILHPLPRVDEISTEVDDTPYAYYFEQAKNALFVRQALLGLLLQQEVNLV